MLFMRLFNLVLLQANECTMKCEIPDLIETGRGGGGLIKLECKYGAPNSEPKTEALTQITPKTPKIFKLKVLERGIVCFTIR